MMLKHNMISFEYEADGWLDFSKEDSRSYQVLEDDFFFLKRHQHKFPP